MLIAAARASVFFVLLSFLSPSSVRCLLVSFWYAPQAPCLYFLYSILYPITFSTLYSTQPAVLLSALVFPVLKTRRAVGERDQPWRLSVSRHVFTFAPFFFYACTYSHSSGVYTSAIVLARVSSDHTAQTRVFCVVVCVCGDWLDLNPSALYFCCRCSAGPPGPLCQGHRSDILALFLSFFSCRLSSSRTR